MAYPMMTGQPNSRAGLSPCPLPTRLLPGAGATIFVGMAGAELLTTMTRLLILVTIAT